MSRKLRSAATTLVGIYTETLPWDTLSREKTIGLEFKELKIERGKCSKIFWSSKMEVLFLQHSL